MTPMLAATVEDPGLLKFPLLASPKLDGIRALVYNGQLVSRTLKLIPNEYIQKSIAWHNLEGIDGELIVGSANAKDCYRVTNSGVMARAGEPKFTFHAFDLARENANLIYRQEKIKRYAQADRRIKVVKQLQLNTIEGLLEYEAECLAIGYEGVMLRSLDGQYKFGRSTLKQGYLMKLKQFSDGEAEVLGVVELQHNNNEQTRDALGKAKRSSHKAGKAAGGTMGALKVKDCVTGVEFEVGAGFTDEDRALFWSRQDDVAGSIIKYKHFPVGVKDKPRHPVYLGIRDNRDY